METVERGLVKLSTALESLPDAREFAALGRSVTAVQGEIAALRATLDGVDRMMAGLDKQLDQINAHLLGGERMSRAADAARTSAFKAGPGTT